MTELTFKKVRTGRNFFVKYSSVTDYTLKENRATFGYSVKLIKVLWFITLTILLNPTHGTIEGKKKLKQKT